MINQVKIGAFLKALRKETGKTQEEIAEVFGVSSRSVSRWENGNTMPDLGILVELADYYNVDIREIIDGERKSEKLDRETKETLLKVADYADNEKTQALKKKKTLICICCGIIIALIIASIVEMACLAGRVVSRQYNAKGISNLLVISIDENQPKEYIGELENHHVYVEGLKTDELYFISAGAEQIPLTEAIAKELISIKGWKRAAWNIVTDGDTETLQYENYEIVFIDDECIIKPISK